MNERRQKWLSQLAAAVWLRVPDGASGFGLADEWAMRVEDEVMDGVLTNTPPSISPPRWGDENATVKPSVTRSFTHSDAAGSIRGATVAKGGAAKAAARAKYPVAAHVTWLLDDVREVHLRCDVDDLPADPDLPQVGRQLVLSCELAALEQPERDRIWRITEELAQRSDLLYGQVGASEDGPALEAAHPKRLGRYQGWRLTRLRGYDWITLVPASMARGIDEAHLDYGRAHLCSVDRLEGGTLRLQATGSPETYDLEAVGHLFRTVAQILPEGAPERPPVLPIPSLWPDPGTADAHLRGSEPVHPRPGTSTGLIRCGSRGWGHVRNDARALGHPQ